MAIVPTQPANRWRLLRSPATAASLLVAGIVALRGGDGLADIHALDARAAWRVRASLGVFYGAVAIVGVSAIALAEVLLARRRRTLPRADVFLRRGLRTIVVVAVWVVTARAGSSWSLRPVADFAARSVMAIGVTGIAWIALGRCLRRWGAASVACAALAIVAVGATAAVAASVVRDIRAARALSHGSDVFLDAIGDQRVSPASRVLLVGIDGASFDFVQAMIARGELPSFAALACRGAMGPLGSAEPTWSPSLWTTIASGWPPHEHGVRGFLGFWFPGLDRAIVDVPLGFGLASAMQLALRLGAIDATPVPSSSCLRPRIWDLVDAAAGRSAIIGWWATTPVSPLHGVMVSDGFWEHDESSAAIADWDSSLAATVHPPERLAAIRTLRESAMHVDLAGGDLPLIDACDEGARDGAVEERLRVACAIDDTHAAIARRLLDEPEPWNLVAVYLRGLDLVSHAALAFGTPLAAPPATGRYADAVRRYYLRTDRVLAELIAAAPPDTDVVVVSDHGFERQAGGGFGHDGAPAGIVFLAGPRVRARADILGATLLDVFPTLLDLVGLAPASDLPGTSLVAGSDAPGKRRDTPQPVASYGTLVRSSAAPAAPQVYSRAVEELRALGYVH